MRAVKRTEQACGDFGTIFPRKGTRRGRRAPRRRASLGLVQDTRPRLRAAPLARPFRIVLVEPEIPQNTGNIARLSAATQSPLHLVGRLGFRIDEHAVRRAGVDYGHLVELEQHLDLYHFQASHPDARLVLFSALASRSYL